MLNNKELAKALRHCGNGMWQSCDGCPMSNNNVETPDDLMCDQYIMQLAADLLEALEDGE